MSEKEKLELLEEIMDREEPLVPDMEKESLDIYVQHKEGQIVSRATYVIPDVMADGYNEILSITVEANETAISSWEC